MSDYSNYQNAMQGKKVLWKELEKMSAQK
jgi:hypothetical protein